MPTKPSSIELNAYKAMKSDPDFGKHALEAVINENEMLKKALLAEGLVEEVVSR